MSLDDALGTAVILAWMVLFGVFISDAYALANPVGFWKWSWFAIRLVLGGLWTSALALLLLGAFEILRYIVDDIEDISVHYIAAFVACFGLVIFFFHPLWSWIF